MPTLAGAIHVRCFHGRGAAGNLHQVIVAPPESCTLLQAAVLSARVTPAILVLVQWPQHASGAYLLSCFFNGVAIMRCGSGCLAAARALIERDASIRMPLHFMTAGGPVQVISRSPDLLGYKINPLPYVHAASLQRWQAVVDRKLHNAVLIGTDRDYCLLELHNQAALAQCSVNARRLSLASKRTVIVTASSHDSGRDYALRYFSPQYGQYEDSATGSAHAMVAAYWQQRLCRQSIRGVQLSAAGGEFSVQRLGLAQCVFGRAETCAPLRD